MESYMLRSTQVSTSDKYRVKNHLLFSPLNFSFSLILIQYTEQEATRESILVKLYMPC